MSQYHKNSDIFMILVAILMKLYTLIGIFIKNHLEKFAGAAINFDKNYRPEYNFKF